MKTTIATIVALVAVTAYAGPFGYEMGQKIEGGFWETTRSGLTVSYRDNVQEPFERLHYTLANHRDCRKEALAAEVEAVDSDELRDLL